MATSLAIGETAGSCRSIPRRLARLRLLLGSLITITLLQLDSARWIRQLQHLIAVTPILYGRCRNLLRGT